MNMPISDVHHRDGVDHGERVRDMFDRIAPTYDRLNRLLSFGIDRSWRTRAISELRVGPGDHVLDLCAGTLDISEEIERTRRPARIVGADFAKEMLEKGRDKTKHVETIVADAMSLPFSDDTFSRVICGFGMRNLQKPMQGMAEVRRVLRRGGVFVTLEFFKPTRRDARVFHAGYARVMLPLLGSALSNDGRAYRYLKDSMKGFLTRTEFESALVHQGFSKVRGFDLTFGIASIVVAEVA